MKDVGYPMRTLAHHRSDQVHDEGQDQARRSVLEPPQAWELLERARWLQDQDQERRTQDQGLRIQDQGLRTQVSLGM